MIAIGRQSIQNPDTELDPITYEGKPTSNYNITNYIEEITSIEKFIQVTKLQA